MGRGGSAGPIREDKLPRRTRTRKQHRGHSCARLRSSALSDKGRRLCPARRGGALLLIGLPSLGDPLLSFSSLFPYTTPPHSFQCYSIRFFCSLNQIESKSRNRAPGDGGSEGGHERGWNKRGEHCRGGYRGFRWHRTGTSAAATSGCKETATHQAAGAAQVEL